jgi:hypothetical protein
MAISAAHARTPSKILWGLLVMEPHSAGFLGRFRASLFLSRNPLWIVLGVKCDGSF